MKKIFVMLALVLFTSAFLFGCTGASTEKQCAKDGEVCEKDEDCCEGFCYSDNTCVKEVSSDSGAKGPLNMIKAVLPE